MLARSLLKRSHYKDPTYIRYLFYFKDRLWGLVEDYNALVSDFKTQTVSLPEVEANFDKLLKSPMKYDILRQKLPIIVILHAYEDTCILQIAYTMGQKSTDPKEGWKAIGMFPWDRIQHAYGETSLFAINVADGDLKKQAQQLYKIVLQMAPANSLPSSPAGFGDSELEFGYFLHISGDYFMALIREESEELKDGRFQCVIFPLLEMSRHKVAYYSRITAESSELVKTAVQNQIGEGYGVKEDVQGSFENLERLSRLVDMSLDDLDVMLDDAHKAQQSYENILSLMKGETGVVGQNFLRYLQTAVENTQYEKDAAAKKVKELNNYLALHVPAPLPAFDAFGLFFEQGDLLYQHFLDCKAGWKFLWDFTETREMVLHDRTHAENVYNILANLIEELKKVGLQLNRLELYCLANTAFLHDVGLNGGFIKDDEGQDVPVIDYYYSRKLHGRIAYHKLIGDLGESTKLPQGARKPVALLSMYHQRKAPIQDEQPPWLEKVDVDNQTFNFTLNPLPSEKVYELRVAGTRVTDTVRLSLLAALLRLADALDVNCNRAGDKVRYEWLKGAIKDRIERAIFMATNAGILLSEEVKNKVRGVWSNTNPQEVANEVKQIAQSANSEKAKIALSYLAHLCGQPEHFRKHRCFQGVRGRLEKENDKNILVAAYMPVQDTGSSLIEKALELVRKDIEEEFDAIKSIEPFSEIAELEVRLSKER